MTLALGNLPPEVCLQKPWTTIRQAWKCWGYGADLSGATRALIWPAQESSEGVPTLPDALYPLWSSHIRQWRMWLLSWSLWANMAGHIERMLYLISKNHHQGHNWPQNMSGSGLNQPVTPSEDTLRVRQLSCRVSEEFPGRLRKIVLGGGWGGEGFDLRGGQHSTLRKSYIPSFSFFLECNINREKN